jgi:hypothetical protein
MVMHLGGCATFVIVITGRWKSATFMEYIREQISQFSEGVSQRMILRHNYFAIPAVDIDFLPKAVDPIYTTNKTIIGRDAPRQLDEMPRFLLAALRHHSSTDSTSGLLYKSTTSLYVIHTLSPVYSFYLLPSTHHRPDITSLS